MKMQPHTWCIEFHVIKLHLVHPFLLHILSHFCGKNQKSERPEDEARTRLSVSAWQLPLICSSPAIFGVNSNPFDREWRTPTCIKCGEKPGHCRQCVLLLFLCAIPNWQQKKPFANLISGQCTKFQCLINWALSFSLFRPHHLNTFIIVSMCVARIEVNIQQNCLRYHRFTFSPRLHCIWPAT